MEHTNLSRADAPEILIGHCAPAFREHWACAPNEAKIQFGKLILDLIDAPYVLGDPPEFVLLATPPSALPLHSQVAATPGTSTIDPAEERPPHPTRQYCLLPLYKVRWIGEPVRLQPRHFKLLQLLLDKYNPLVSYTDYEVSFQQVQAAVYTSENKHRKIISNDVRRLSKGLLKIGFPLQFATKDNNVIRER
jgi:hypothetical protein